MAWGIIVIILKVAGAIGVFIYGVKLMSEGLQKVAGSKMRNVLGKITNNPISGILTGTAVTAAIQSSTATTVMVVSFVNTGLLSLAGAIAVVMGANIGTTVTSWIILLGFGGSGDKFLFPLVVIALALPFMMMKRDKMKSLSEFFIGFGTLLIGLQFLQDAMPDLSQNQAFLEAMSQWSGWGYLSILVFIVIGALLTVILQASSAVMAITMVMCARGWIGFDMAVAIIMGQNIGTTLTANIAAMVANASGKKAARAHLVFNVIGVLLTLIVFYPLMNLICSITESVSGYNPHAVDVENAKLVLGEAKYQAVLGTIPLAITIFHTFFNIVTTVILAFFIPQLIKIVNWMVKVPAEDTEDEYRLKFISGGYLNTAELNIQSAQKEIENFSRRVLRMYTFLPDLDKLKGEDFNKLMERVSKYESITDRMEMEIASFLTKVSSGDLSKESSQKISSMLRIVDNLESIGDAIYQLAINKKNQRTQKITFDQQSVNNLDKMYELVSNSLKVMDSNLCNDYANPDLDSAYEAEKAVNKHRDFLRAHHLDALKAGAYSYQYGTLYSGMYALYEKLGDYVINVSEAIDNSRKLVEHQLMQQDK